MNNFKCFIKHNDEKIEIKGFYSKMKKYIVYRTVYQEQEVVVEDWENPREAAYESNEWVDVDDEITNAEFIGGQE